MSDVLRSIRSPYRETWVKLANIVKHARALDAVLKQTTIILRQGIPHYNWVGVYMVEGAELVLRGWAGPEATQHTRIPLGQGICGLAARTGRTVNVPDVAKDPRYLQCFMGTKSELVVPIAVKGKVVGEVDIDSDAPAAFTATDEGFVGEVANLLALEIEGLVPEQAPPEGEG